MIDPDKLEAMAQVIYDRENQFNTYTLEKIAKRVKATGELSAYDQESLKNIADITGDMDAITKELARITKLNIADVEKIYAKTINDGINSYEPLYNFKNIEFKSYKDNEYALKLVRHWAEITAEKMINLSNSKIVGFTDSKGNFTTIAETYQQVIDDAIVAVSNGTVDFNSAMEETIKRLGGSGVVTNYGNKITRPIESAIRSNILYGAKKAAESYDNYVSEELGLDGFEVDAHSGCRPSHVFMQGKMYSYGGKKTIKGVTYEDGADALSALEDYGCLHFKTGVLLGVSEPRYSQEELDRIHKETTEEIEYNGKKKTLYEWKQTQRRLEREYRKTKTQSDTFKAAGNNAKAREYKDAAKAIKDNYDTMTKAVPGLYNHSERMRTYFNSTASVKGTTPTPKKVVEVPSKKYVEATTKEQAEEIAKKFGVDADYKGYDISVANAINKTMQDYEDIFGEHTFDNLEVIKSFEKGEKLHEWGGYSSKNKSIQIRGVKSKDAIEKFGKTMEKYGEGYFSTDSNLHVIRHEVGHSVHDVVDGVTMSNIQKYRSKIGADVYSEVSFRAGQDDYEFVAECLAQYLDGNPSEIATEVVDILRKGFKYKFK